MMKKFTKPIIMLVASLIPVQTWRKAFRNRYLHKFPNPAFGTLLDIFLEIKIKKESLLAHKDTAQTIFVGSSHVAYAFNPRYYSSQAFNLGSNSQDLFTSYKLVSYWNSILPNLKNILVGYDIFSRGLSLDHTSATHICSAYHYLYHIDYPIANYTPEQLVSSQKLDQMPLSADKKHYNGYLTPPPLSIMGTIQDRKNGHLREHNREISQHIWLEKIFSTNDRKQLFMVLLPLQPDYLAILPPKKLLFNEAIQLAKRYNVKVVDLVDDPDFTNEDFYDFDHLNFQGAQKFSTKLKDLL